MKLTEKQYADKMHEMIRRLKEFGLSTGSDSEEMKITRWEARQCLYAYYNIAEEDVSDDDVLEWHDD